MKLFRLPAIVAIGIFAAYGSFAQSTPRVQFEAATIKLNSNCAGGGRGGSSGMRTPGRVTLECAQLRDLILTAYEVYGGSAGPRSFRMQVLGGPAWIDSDRFDLLAKADGDPPLSQMYGPMLQGLLEDRLKLKVHRETRETPIYLLTVVKGGPRLRATPEGSCLSTDDGHPLPPAVPGRPSRPACGSVKTDPSGKIDMYGVTMAAFSLQLGFRVDREIIDKTGMTGKYDVHLEVSKAEMMPRYVAGGSAEESAPLSPDLTAGPSIFTALQQQLGLKLEPSKGPASVLVIDHIERPSAN